MGEMLNSSPFKARAFRHNVSRSIEFTVGLRWIPWAVKTREVIRLAGGCYQTDKAFAPIHGNVSKVSQHMHHCAKPTFNASRPDSRVFVSWSLMMMNGRPYSSKARVPNADMLEDGMRCPNSYEIGDFSAVRWSWSGHLAARICRRVLEGSWGGVGETTWHWWQHFIPFTEFSFNVIHLARQFFYFRNTRELSLLY